MKTIPYRDPEMERLLDKYRLPYQATRHGFPLMPPDVANLLGHHLRKLTLDMRIGLCRVVPMEVMRDHRTLVDLGWPERVVMERHWPADLMLPHVNVLAALQDAPAQPWRVKQATMAYWLQRNELARIVCRSRAMARMEARRMERAAARRGEVLDTLPAEDALIDAPPARGERRGRALAYVPKKLRNQLLRE